MQRRIPPLQVLNVCRGDGDSPIHGSVSHSRNGPSDKLKEYALTSGHDSNLFFDEFFHLFEIRFERFTSFRGQFVRRLRLSVDKALRRQNILRVLELLEMHAQIAVSRSERFLQIHELDLIARNERAHDPQADLGVDYIIKLFVIEILHLLTLSRRTMPAIEDDAGNDRQNENHDAEDDEALV